MFSRLKLSNYQLLPLKLIICVDDSLVFVLKLLNFPSILAFIEEFTLYTTLLKQSSQDRLEVAT